MNHKLETPRISQNKSISCLSPTYTGPRYRRESKSPPWNYRISPVFVQQISANVSCSGIYFYIYCANYCSVFVPGRAVLVQKLNNNSTGEATGSPGSPGVTRSGLTGYFFYQKNPRCGPVPVPPSRETTVWSSARLLFVTLKEHRGLRNGSEIGGSRKHQKIKKSKVFEVLTYVRFTHRYRLPSVLT